MHQKYIKLFKELSHSVQILSEQVKQYNHEKQDEKGEQTAKTMHEDYVALHNKLSADDFDPTTLTKAEYARLFVASLIIINSLETRITNEQNTVKNYKEVIIPKFERIINECENDEQVKTLADELFKIEEDK